MAVDQRSEGWLRYRAAIEVLYEASIEEIVAGGRAGLERNPSEEAVDEALSASIDLNDRLVNDIYSEDSDRREAGVLWLLAVASIDLSIANDLVPYDEPPDPEAWDGPALAATLPDALEVLEPRSGDPFAHRRIAGGAEPDREEASALLQASIDAATRGILGDSASTSVSTIAILLGDVAEYLQPATTTLPNEICQKLEVGSKRLRRVVRFLTSGLHKVLSTLGKKRDEILEKVGEWVSEKATDFETGLIEGWLAGRYGTEELRPELGALIAQSEQPPWALVGAADSLDLLAARFHTQMRFARYVAWLIRRARKWLMHAATPWSQIAVVSGSVIATGAVVCLGQDYIDGPAARVPRLGLIQGVEPIVRQALVPPDPAEDDDRV